MGPVEYIVVSFPGNEFNGRIVPDVNADRNEERAPVEKGSASVRSYLAA
jgi:hypothetical protein